METNNVYQFTTGPRDASILLVGEAWGYDEAQKCLPFQGISGSELNRMLADSGLNRNQILCTNVVSKQPPGNDFTKFLNPNPTRKSAEIPSIKGVYPARDLTDGLKRLHDLIQQVNPKLIIGAGNWPLWALTSHAKVATTKGYKTPSGIMSWRGSQTWTDEINGKRYPYLPIIHPAAICRDMSSRHITCHDLRSKAKAYVTGRLDWTAGDRPSIFSGSFTETISWLRELDSRLNHKSGSGDPAGSGNSIELCVDVETWRKRYLAVVGICDGRSAIAIPFFYFDPSGAIRDCFTLEQEHAIIFFLRRILTHPRVSIINQNYAYDWQMLAFWLKIYKYPTFDTMLAHHLIFPGTPKSLGYLASMYAKNYCYWKEESQDWDAKSTHTEMWEYNCKDTWYTFEIAQVLKALIKRTGKEELYAFQMEQWELYIETMAEGVRWDREKAQIFRTQLLKMANELGTWLLECMPEDIRYTDSGKPWFSSNTHLQWIFYDLLGVKEVLHKQTKKRTLGKESFEILKKDKPWLGPILDRMKLLRSVNVFSRNFLDVGLGMDGRMHSSFNVGGTETFRLSSSSNAFDEGMNLQNLPKKEED